MSGDENVRFAAYIHPSNPASGSYGGMSIALFPVDEGPALMTFVTGTGGLHPDEEILGNPGHARKARALCAWLNEAHGAGEQVAWAKHDPVRTDVSVPTEVIATFSAHQAALRRYGREIYALYRPTEDAAKTREAVAAFFDLMLSERGYETLASQRADSEAIQTSWFSHLTASATEADVSALLARRRYVVLQGPPGTGKTRMAQRLIADQYGGRGTSVQFHPSTSYETFVGGFAPAGGAGDVGLAFKPTPGALMQAIERAGRSSEPYLLHIDEINRADLAKVLGEAIYLLEPTEKRSIQLPHDFGPPFHRTLTMPSNLHILGTMNTADRSLAMIDVAVRRRFAFVDLWPDGRVVAQGGSAFMAEAFNRLTAVFVDHATDEAFNLMPGHSYFLATAGDDTARNQLQVTLAPLLNEYLSQGYVSGFEEPIRAYMQWLAAR